MNSIIPGKYYFNSRFDSKVSAISYFIKYWVSYLLVVYLSVNIDLIEFIIISFLSILSFYSYYDFFCYSNDVNSYKNESKKSSIERYAEFTSYNRLTNCVFFVFSCVYFYFNLDKSGFLIFVIASLLIMVTFFFHNSVKPSNRLTTFFLLYLLKPFAVGGFMFFSYDNYEFLLFSILYAFSYFPEYAMRKSESRMILTLFGYVKPKFLKPIILKIVFGLLMCLLNGYYIAFVFVQLSLTFFEVTYNRLVSR